MSEDRKPLALVAKGTYLAKCVDLALTKSGQKGTRQAEAIFKIAQPGSEFDGRGVGWRGFFTEATAEKTLEALENLGLKDAASNLGRLVQGWKPEPDHLVSIVVEHEEGKDKEGNAKTFARVRWVNYAGGAKIKNESKLAVDEGDEFAREIAALYGKATSSTPPAKTESKSEAKKPPAPAPKPKDKPAPTPTPPAEDDDIPF